MPDFNASALLSLLSQLRNWMTSLNEQRAQEDERIQEALDSLLAALRETRAYMRRLDHGESRDRLEEEELSAAWNEAAVKLQPLNSDLAKRASLKGYYWADPEDWNRSERKDAEIKLGVVFDEAQEMIEGE